LIAARTEPCSVARSALLFLLNLFLPYRLLSVSLSASHEILK
jgi:hypothetical protein